MAQVIPQKNIAICQSHSEYRVAKVYQLMSLWTGIVHCRGAKLRSRDCPP